MGMELLRIAEELQKDLGALELCRGQADRAGELGRKLQSRNLSVAVIGQFKRGKTTFVNKLLGADILPTGIIPITAAATRILYDDSCSEIDNQVNATVVFENGSRRDVNTGALHQYISEQENHDNVLGVAEVLIRTNAGFLPNGMEVVDTPGVGSVHEKNSNAAYDYAGKSDAVVFMLSVDSPINKIETDFLEKAVNYSGKFYFCVNKADIVSREEIHVYIEYCRDILSGLLGVNDIKIFPISAKTGAGVDEFCAELKDDLLSSCGDIIDESVGLKLLNLIDGTCRQISSYRAVINMVPNVFRSRFKKMDEILEERRRINSRLTNEKLDVTRLNEEKIYLMERTTELFGIDYYFELDSTNAQGFAYTLQPAAATGLTHDEYVERAEKLYIELKSALDAIFMYKEENAYTVARRIEDMNILIRRLKKYREQVKKHGK